jgi:hypothetical protein
MRSNGIDGGLAALDLRYLPGRDAHRLSELGLGEAVALWKPRCGLKRCLTGSPRWPGLRRWTTGAASAAQSPGPSSGRAFIERSANP